MKYFYKMPKNNKKVKIYFSNLENNFLEYETLFCFKNNSEIIQIYEIGKEGDCLFGKIEKESIYLFGQINNFEYEFVLDKIKKEKFPEFFGKYQNLEKKIEGEALLEILD